MKKKHFLISLITFTLAVLSIPLTILSFGFGAKQYDETYYGELPYMVKRLKSIKEKKIIFVGNSAVAFSIRPDLLEEELNTKCVMFGLYGAIGTKAMMELSKVNIKKDDIVILMPELTEQSLSMYFSSSEMWMAFDGNYNLINYLDKEDQQLMVGNFAKFASNKMKYIVSGSKPSTEGVYMQKSFNLNGSEVGYMTYEREYNTMLLGYEPNTLIDFNKDIVDKDFIDYVNEYSKYINSKGAALYYGFPPLNSLANTASSEEINNFYNFLADNLSCPILGNPNDYLLDFEWFYDSNTHLNSPGVYIYNKLICDDIKTVLNDYSETKIEIPEKPNIPVEKYEDGDNLDAGLFEYEPYVTGYRIIGISEEGKKRTKITIPSTYNDMPVVTFTADVFSNNNNLSEIIIPNNIKLLNDYSFDGDEKLTRLILAQENPSAINIGMALIDGAPNCSIYVKTSAYDSYITNYNWGFYKDRIKKY